MNITQEALEKILELGSKAEQKAWLDGYNYGIQNGSRLTAPEVKLPIRVVEVPQERIEPKQPVQPVQPTLPLGGGAGEDDYKPRYRMNHRGLRAKILRMLYTGATGYNSLVKVIGAAGGPVTQMLNQLEKTGMITELRQGLYGLTEPKGRAEAKWFVDHPNFKVKNTRKDPK